MDTVEYKRAGRLNRLRLVKYRPALPGRLRIAGGEIIVKISARHIDKATILDVTGNIDMSNSPEMRKALLREIRDKERHSRGSQSHGRAIYRQLWRGFPR